ncbi:MAG: pilus assembly protein [Euzebyales bacterium]|jgi:pilus assembly protein CpaE|nr:pilus assembly protein [Euzebyales bacterium]
MSRLRRDGGALSVEFVGMLPIVAFAALVVWQLLLAGLVATTAENAARAGSREASLSTAANGQSTAIEALSPWLRDGADATVSGSTAIEVTVPIPIVLPGVSHPGWTVTRTAEFPKD